MKKSMPRKTKREIGAVNYGYLYDEKDLHVKLASVSPST